MPDRTSERWIRARNKLSPGNHPVNPAGSRESVSRRNDRDCYPSGARRLDNQDGPIGTKEFMPRDD
jgi:hypothetical protein